MKLLSVLALLFLMVGCASTAHQSEALLKTKPADLPPSFEISNLPFVEQSVGHCGPATLAMLMNFQGRKISAEELVPQVYTPGMKGSFQSDMISATRRNGFLAIEIQGMSSLLREVAAGNPVIVFENLALSWSPTYHYAVVYGYDFNSKEVLMHSGPEQGKHWDMRKFERSWMLEKYWGLLVLKPGQISATASELSHLTAAAGLEQIGRLKEADISYQAILKHWPSSLGALIGLGNIAYTQKEYKKSVHYLREAVAAHPDSTQAKHNLKVAETAL